MTEQPNDPIAFNEAPLLALPPGVSLLSPSKPLIEMSDAELQEWHARHRDHRNPQTFMAHLRSVGEQETGKKKASGKPKPDMSDFV